MNAKKVAYSANRDTHLFNYHQTSSEISIRSADFSFFEVNEVTPCQTFFD